MKKQIRQSLLLAAILIFFSLTYLATTVPFECGGDCINMNKFTDTLTKRWTFVEWVYPGGKNNPYDTLKVNLRRIQGINWNSFADTVCMLLNISGMSNRTIYFVDGSVRPPDTILSRHCP